ncbi:MAG: beta-ketoacyl synthase N-terminal-like domain-containing protein [Bacteroidales bacterium]|nr:beta-ketoacyl synthase N-terminal-like domain-containing protein [Bacteroidales bacterium]
MKHKIISLINSASISALGIETEEVYNNCISSKHLLCKQSYNGKDYWVGSLNAESEDVLQEFVKANKNFSRADRTVSMAAFTAEKLINKTEFELPQLNKLCISIGSSRGPTGLWEKFYGQYLNSTDKVTPLLTSPLTTHGHISSEVASHIGADGINIDNSTTCSTGIQAVMNALVWIKSGYADFALAGASEAPLSPFTMAQVEALKLYDADINKEFPCMPFAYKKSNAFVLGEAAALVLLQELDISTVKKSKEIIVVESFGFSYEKPPSLTGIDEGGHNIYLAMKMALKNQISRTPVDMILMHMPGTVKGDIAELNAIHNLFGEKLPYLYSGKWKTGHTYAASGVLNIEFAMLCIKNNFFPEFPYETMEKISKPEKCRKIMINTAGFGGNAASIIISKSEILFT